MSFLPDPAEPLSADEQAVWERAVESYPHQHPTNMKRTLLRDEGSFDMYIEYYGLFGRLAEIIGARAVNLFCYAISETNDCLICSLYFRRILIDGGADPENPEPTVDEQVLMDFGQAISRNPTAIPDELYASVKQVLPDPQHRVLIVAFAAQMVAANVFNSVGRIPLDESLYDYRKPGDERV